MRIRLFSISLLIGCTLCVCTQPLHAAWKLVQSNVGTKTYSVTMNFSSKWNKDEVSPNWPEPPTWEIPPGFSVGSGSVSLPGGASFSVATCAGIHIRLEDPEDPFSELIWGPGEAYWYIDTTVSDYAAKDGTYVTRRMQLMAQGESAQLTVTVTGQADRWANLDVAGVSDPWWMGISRRNGAADIMANTGVEVKDVINYPTVTVTMGGQSFTYTSGALMCDDNSIGVSAWAASPTIVLVDPDQGPEEYYVRQGPDGYYIFPQCSEMGTWDGAYDTGNTTWVTGSYSRSTRVAQKSRSFSYTYTSENGIGQVYSKPGTVQIKKNVTVGNGSFFLAGGYVNGAPDSIGMCAFSTTKLCGFSFTDYCGAYDVDYARDIKNMDGSLRADIHVAGYEQHPTEHTAPVTGLSSDETVGHCLHTYTWDNNYIDISSGPTVHYGGRWAVNAEMPGGSQDYVDLPYNVTTGAISHGNLTADNIKDSWNQSSSSYNGNAPGEPSHPGWEPWPDQRYDDDTGEPMFAANGEPIWACGETENGCPWYDNQVLVKGGWTASDALQIDLASPGDVPNPPLDFFDLNGWVVTGGTSSKSAPYLIINTPSSGTTTAEIADLLPENIRLTGTRFAKVKWSASTAGARATLSLGGHSWNLKAGTAGTQTTLIDLCSPDESTVPGLVRTTTQQATGTVNQITESVHPTVGPADDWYTITAPEGTTEMSLYFSEVEGEYGYVEIYDKDNNYIDYVWDWSGGQWTPWYTAPGGILKIRVTASQGISIYGFKVSRYQYKKPATVDASVMQSIIPYEQPVDASLYDEQLSHGKRQEDSSYDWEFPAGWGVGRVVSAKLECKTPDTQYGFECIQLYRKTAQEGGFAKLYVLPHQPSWNDSRQLNDWSWFDSGSMALPWCTNYRYIIRKAHLVVDGAVVLEIPAGTCEQDNHPQYGYSHPTPWYIYSPSKLLPGESSSGMHVLAYPVDDYSNPTSYATNGVATVGVNLAEASDFIKENCYVTYLVGGTYSEGADNKIKVPLDITPDGISPHLGSFGTVVKGMTKRVRGGAQGLAFQENGEPAANRQVRVATPGAPSGQKTDTAVTTNLLGWFDTPALNTKADATLETSVGLAYLTTRNRFLSRIAIAPLGLGNSTFEITDVAPFVIEPAYDDTVNIKWRRTDGQSNVESILILSHNESGAIVGSDGIRYDLVATLPLGQAVENPEWNPPANPYRWLGEATWQPPQNQAAGHYNAGVLFDDDSVQTKWTNGGESCEPSFNVAVSVYDVYSDSSSPFYPGGDNPAQAQTTIHYTLSSQVDGCKLVQADKELQGSGSQGENTEPWDGAIDAQETYCDSGVYPIEVYPDLTGTDLIAGLPLSIADSTTWKVAGSTSVQASSFDPEAEEHLEVQFRIAEPVKRTQATAAYLTARIYDATTAKIVRMLADAEETTSIDTDGDDINLGGENTLSWDGNDDDGQPVAPGSYVITLFAKDNAGVGCESRVAEVNVEVVHDEGCVLDADYSTDGSQIAVTGITNSGNSVSWTDTVGGNVVASGTAELLDDEGDFYFTLEANTFGLHSITLTTTGQQTAEQTLEVFLNNISLSATETVPAPPPYGETGRFNPGDGQSVSITVSSQADDSLDVEVIDPFDSSTCIGTSDPTKASEFLNGAVREKSVKKIWTNHGVNAGQATFSWDGTDGDSNSVPAGPYVIRVSRTNSDGRLYTSFDVAATVDTTGTNPPTISDTDAQAIGTAIAVSWKTNVPTTGAVLYNLEDSAIARVSSGDLSTFHIVYFPVTEPETDYTYWIVAQDESGNTSASPKLEITTGQGESLGDVSTKLVSVTAVDVKWATSADMFGRVEYAQVGPSVGNLSWLTSDETVAAKDHVVHLTGLSANSEYVVRVSCASTASFVGSSTSPYVGFVTETSKPSVSIEAPEPNTVLSGTVSVEVVASDVNHRFESNGVSRVELYADEMVLSPTSHTPGSDDYSFSLDTSQLTTGVHQLVACATDDFWNTNSYTIDVYVDNSGGGGMMAQSVANAQAYATSSSVSSLKALGHIIARGTNPIEFFNGNVDNGKGGGRNDFWFIWCRAEKADTIIKEFHYVPNGIRHHPSNWVSSVGMFAPGRVVGAINGGVFNYEHWIPKIIEKPNTSTLCGDLWIRDRGIDHYDWLVHDYTTTRPQRWSYAMNDTGSDFFVERMEIIDPSKKGTSEQRCRWKSADKLTTYDYARSFVGCVMKDGKALSQKLSAVVDSPGDAEARSLVAWSKPDSNGRRHFFLVALKHDTWDGVTAFFSKNGRLAREMAKTFGVPNLQIDTVVWLDGGTSTELDYMVRKSRTTWHPSGPRSSLNKYQPDIISVKSLLPPLQFWPEE